jgi:hypothetical protein
LTEVQRGEKSKSKTEECIGTHTHIYIFEGTSVIQVAIPYDPKLNENHTPARKLFVRIKELIS